LSSRSAKSILLNVFIWAISLSYGFSDWNIYKQNYLAHPEGWKLHLTGGIEAPSQYRMGPWIVVDWMYRWLRWKPYDTQTLLDVLCLALALWVMLRVLRNGHRYRTLPPRMRWLPLVGAFFLAEYYLAWGHWYQTGVTIPSILFVVLSLVLIDGKTVPNRLTASLLLVFFGCIQGFIRADVAVVMHAGIFLAAVFGRKSSLPLGRLWQAITSLVTAALAGCVQLYLMLVKFPQAKYGPGGVFRLTTNIHPGMWLTMLLALLPFWLLLVLVASERHRLHGPETALLIASLLYLVVWATVGLIDEVRIFLPFSFALIPAAAMALTGCLPEENHTGRHPYPMKYDS
jgi:hypothetical protein